MDKWEEDESTSRWCSGQEKWEMAWFEGGSQREMRLGRGV